MTDHPTIHLDPALVAEVHELTAQAQQLILDQVAPLAERVGAVMLTVDRLTGALDDDQAVNALRERLGYGQLVDAMGIMASHAAAASDEPTATFGDPEWYDRLREQRYARWAKQDRGAGNVLARVRRAELDRAGLV